MGLYLKDETSNSPNNVGQGNLIDMEVWPFSTVFVFLLQFHQRNVSFPRLNTLEKATERIQRKST